jgi:hypothetical protein
MRRLTVAAACSLALAIASAAPTGAAVPVSVLGSGKTRVVLNYSSSTSVRTVTVATTTKPGVISVSGRGVRVINCVASFTKQGIKMVLATTVPTGGRWFILALSEGGGTHKPYALVHDGPFFTSSGLCNSGFGQGSFPLDLPVAYQVPANRYLVVGG